MITTEQELEEFKSEAMELLEGAEKSLLAIDVGVDFKKKFDSVFRCFHNLKGSAGMMDLSELQSHTHELETNLMKFKDSPSIPKDHVNYFLNGIDGAKSILEGKKCQSSPVQSSPVQSSLSLASHLP